MATPTPTSTDPNQQQRITSAYSTFKHNAALTMLVVAPLLIAIPPRKLDLYTFSLTGAFVASINQLTVERTGRGIVSQFGYQYSRNRGDIPIPRAGAEQEVSGHRLLELPDGARRRVGGVSVNGSEGAKEGIAEMAKGAWLGGESEDWKERRLKEEREKLSRGEGYADMIVDQIWEVWNQGEKKTEEKEGKEG